MVAQGRFKWRSPSLAFWLFHGPIASVSLAFFMLAAFVFWGPDNTAYRMWRELDRDGGAMLPFLTLLFVQPLLAVVGTVLYFGGRRRTGTLEVRRNSLRHSADNLVAEPDAFHDVTAKGNSLVVRSGERTARLIPLEQITGGFVEIIDADRSRVVLHVGNGQRAQELDLETEPETAELLAAKILGTSRSGLVAGPSGVRIFLSVLLGGVFALVGAVPLVGALEQVNASFPHQMWNFLQGFSWTVGGVGAAMGMGLFAAAWLLRPTSISVGSDGLTIGGRFIAWSNVRHIDQTGWALAVHTKDSDMHEVFAFGRSRLASWDRLIRDRLEQRVEEPTLDLPAYAGNAESWISAIRKQVLGGGYRDGWPDQGRLAHAVRATGASPEVRIAAAVALRATEPEKAAMKIRVASKDVLCDATRAALEAIADDAQGDDACTMTRTLAIEAAVTRTTRG